MIKRIIIITLIILIVLTVVLVVVAKSTNKNVADAINGVIYKKIYIGPYATKEYDKEGNYKYKKMPERYVFVIILDDGDHIDTFAHINVDRQTYESYNEGDYYKAK